MKSSRFLLATLLVASTARAQAVPQLTLSAPTGTRPDEFSKIIAAEELAPGRLLVADERERRLVILDFAGGASKTVSRIGSGPGEYRSIGALLPRRGGGAWVSDFALRRLLAVLPDGSTGDAVQTPTSTLHFSSVDTGGRLLGSVMIFRDRVLSDSMFVARWDVATGRVDTILKYDAGRSGMVSHGEPMRVWYSTTSWAPLDDDGILLLDAGYQLRKWRAGNVTHVATLPLDRKPVTEEDKKALRAERDAAPVQGLGQGGARPSSAPKIELVFPATFPAFEADARLMRAPDGNFWIERLISPRDSIPVFDVIAPEGRVIGRVQMPVRSRVIAFGKGAVYVVTRDTDDVERIRRFAYPGVGRR